MSEKEPAHMEPLPHDHGQHTHEVLEQMPTPDSFAKVSDTFSLLSDSTRLRILWLLCHSEECVYNIAAAIGMSAPAVSHHLRALRQSGLIVNRRIGKEIHYTLAGTPEAELVHRMVDDIFQIQCPRRHWHQEKAQS
ncbi:ArsR/SmtB family transcription factor [Christensenella sp. MSJ-20]|uniref:ArsR/SmtB family transcription factor n=1 Tax=Christensenella sp. MSJ-20 TaxID=2841518 RepID=UPI0037C0BB5B